MPATLHQQKHIIMKTRITSIIAFAVIFLSIRTSAQGLYATDKFAVVNVDAIGMSLDPKLGGEILRRELMKLNVYNVADVYDQEYILRQNNISVDSCYSLYCLQEISDVFKVDKIMTGSVSKINKNIIVTLKIYDVKSKSWAKMGTESFNDLEDQISIMIELTLKKMLNIPYDQDKYQRMTLDKSFYDNIELQNKEEANLSGPRFGVGYMMGTFGEVMKAPKEQGGLNSYPLMSHLGYQFEKVFISSGNTHALVEFLPILSGFEHNTIIPSLNLLLGVRNSKNGLEFAMGYNAAISKFKDASITNGDVRYKPGISTGIVFAAGKTFKSGRLNFPLNVYFIPGSQNSHRVGVTMGFNIPRKR
jgi:hypothetical protein